MKATAFFVLSLTALLLGPWQDPPHRHAKAQAMGARAEARPPAAASTPIPDAPQHGAARRQAPVAPPATDPAVNGAAPASLAARPAAIAGETPSGPAAVAATPTDWRASAQELLSQIGLFCPTTGCDSLEDD